MANVLPAASAPASSTAVAIPRPKDGTPGVAAIGPVNPPGVGAWMTAHHVGDITGILGLLLTGLTFVQARAAKKAAREAADAAIRSRDRLEAAAALMHLSTSLRGIAAGYDTDDWSYLGVPKDQAVAVAVQLEATLSDDAAMVTLMTQIRTFLREPEPSIAQIKEQARRDGIKAKRSLKIRKLADDVDLARTKRVKNGS